METSTSSHLHTHPFRMVQEKPLGSHIPSIPVKQQMLGQQSIVLEGRSYRVECLQMRPTGVEKQGLLGMITQDPVLARKTLCQWISLQGPGCL